MQQLMQSNGARLSPLFVLVFLANVIVLLIQTLFIANYFSTVGLTKFSERSEGRGSLSVVMNAVKEQKNMEAAFERRMSAIVEAAESMKEKLISLRGVVDRLSCRTFGIASKGGFCLSDESVEVGGNQVWNVDLANEIERLVGNGSLVDLGAGLGWYGRYFTRSTKFIFPEAFRQSEIRNYFNRSEVMENLKTPRVIAKYEGYDGGVNVDHYTTGFIRFTDLSEKQDLGHKFDWIMSLEVGEHIPKEYEHVFIDNLVRHACRGIVLSWAVEGQGGHFHVNNQNNSYVKEQFDKRGFRDCPKQDLILRKTSQTGGGYWFADTLMAFIRKVPFQHGDCQTEYPAVEC